MHGLSGLYYETMEMTMNTTSCKFQFYLFLLSEIKQIVHLNLSMNYGTKIGQHKKDSIIEESIHWNGVHLKQIHMQT